MLPLNIDPMPIPNQVINLISNLPPITTSVAGGQISPGAWGSSSFTIGTNPFVLTSITLRFAQITAATPPNNLFVRLYNDNSGNPGSEITSFTFTNPGSITTTTANNIFTLSTPQTLAANTTFWLVVGSGSGQYVWALTNSVNETGESGWSIGNNSSLFSSNQGGTWTSYNNLYFQFSINGQSYSLVTGDPYLPNTSLLLHADGANNSTNIIDSSSNPKLIARSENVSISTDQSRFGGSSILINSGVVSSSSSLDFAFGSEDFTIEGWIYLLTIPSFGFPDLFRTTDDLLYINFRQSGIFAITTASAIIASSPSPVPLNQWSYFAVTRSGSVFRVWLDGVGGTPATANLTFASTATAIRFGNGNVPLHAYIDEYRITKGVAREITLPTAPFPDL
jgi:hypothetical protein